MTELICEYPGDRDEALVTFLYDEDGATGAERARFDAHLKTCARCLEDLASLQGVRTQLAQWSPPEPGFLRTTPAAPVAAQAWWREIPAWAQVAAALLVLGVSAGIANLDVRYDSNGLSVRTGWSKSVAGAPATPATVQAGLPPGSTPWKADLSAIEEQMKADVRALRTAAASNPPQTARTTNDADVVRRVRALLDESEKRQQRELALRVAEVFRDVNAQRRADLVKIDRTLGVVQNQVGVEVLKNRQQIDQMNLAYRASQRQ